MITVKNLTKSFGDNHVLKNINEHIAPGEKVVIIGPSGSGKSTFLRCMNLLEVPTSGQIIFDGKDITDPHANINEIREHMGMVFQHFNLFANLSVEQNLTLAPVKLKRMSKDEAHAEAMELLKRRKEKQPLEYPSCGSAFKRPEGYFAGELIEKCGLKGYAVGGACVSEKHAGFVINKGGATSEDVEKLLSEVRAKVLQTFGVELVPEIRMIK